MGAKLLIFMSLIRVVRSKIKADPGRLSKIAGLPPFFSRGERTFYNPFPAALRFGSKMGITRKNFLDYANKGLTKLSKRSIILKLTSIKCACSSVG